MSQSTDYSIANATGSAVRADLNSVFGAVATNNSGATAPSTMYSYMWWADTTANKLKMRNGSNSAWIEIGTLDTANLDILAGKFPNVSGTVTLTHTELNNVDKFASGTKLVFYQASAPAGWSQDTSNNDKALRVVSGSGGGTGGSMAFSSAFTHTHADDFASASVTLTTSQMPSHTHAVELFDGNLSGNQDVPRNSSAVPSSVDATDLTQATGGGGSHTHTLSGSVTSATIAPHYIDVIVCSKT
jgi:hypothetical protein